MFKKIVLTVATSMLALSAFAANPASSQVAREQVAKAYELKDGSTVYIFKDGKMGMEDKNGRSVRMKQGHPMETKDGGKIMMKGDEVWRVEDIVRQKP